jgi:hypothetical protein
MKLKMILIMMLLMQTKLPSLYQNLTFIDGKCKKSGIVVIYGSFGRANEHNIEDINAIDSNLLLSSITALEFDFEAHEYYIPIDDRIYSEIDKYNRGDTVSIDIVFLLQKDRKGVRHLSYITSIQKK